jgi:hypothetical protein
MALNLAPKLLILSQNCLTSSQNRLMTQSYQNVLVALHLILLDIKQTTKYNNLDYHLGNLIIQSICCPLKSGKMFLY